MKQRILAFIMILALFAGVYQVNKAMSAIRFEPSVGDTGEVPRAISAPVPKLNWVVITGEVVNARDSNGTPTAYVERGQDFPVRWLDTGWGVILAGDLQGLMIWKGCTNQANGLGCHSK